MCFPSTLLFEVLLLINWLIVLLLLRQQRTNRLTDLKLSLHFLHLYLSIRISLSIPSDQINRLHFLNQVSSILDPHKSHLIAYVNLKLFWILKIAEIYSRNWTHLLQREHVSPLNQTLRLAVPRARSPHVQNPTLVCRQKQWERLYELSNNQLVRMHKDLKLHFDSFVVPNTHLVVPSPRGN